MMIVNSLTKKAFLFSALSAAIFGLSACQPSDNQNSSANAESSSLNSHSDSDSVNMPATTENADGPRADKQRTIAERKVQTNANGTATIIDIDFGNVSDGDYSAPLRGLIISPTKASTPTPLVVISHLRAPNCTDKNFAYPCAEGVQEFRYDKGMQYFGEYLAEQGYTVIIPDLGGIFIGVDIESPYSQTAMWEKAVTRFAQALKDNKQTENLGAQLAPVDFSKVALFAHSRSGMLEKSAQKVFGKDNLRSILAYAPAYDTVELEEISPAPIDVPYLAIVGSMDEDVGASANLWLSHYATTARQSPAATVELPALGHMYINRAASAAEFDDRKGCDMVDCPDAKAHENALLTIAGEWFGTTLRGQETTLPVAVTQQLPEKITNLSARWFALTPSAVGFVEAKDFDNAKLCIYVDPSNPRPPENTCPSAENGFVQILTPVAYLKDPTTAKTNIQGAHGLVLQVAPTDSYEHISGTPVSLTLKLKNHPDYTLNIDGTHPALMNRQTEHENGTYRLGTVRVALPEYIAADTITAVSIQAAQPIVVRSVDFW